MCFAAVLDGIWHRHSDGTRLSLNLAVATVIARGIRGVEGVRWVGPIILDFLDGADKQLPLQTVLQAAASHVAAKFKQECTRRQCDLWPAHREGRHASLSGRHFLEALASRQGMRSALKTAQALAGQPRRHLKHIFKHNFGIDILGRESVITFGSASCPVLWHGSTP